jgi:mannose-6-phosphate isomerase-like protein (cupin superfamily)
VNGSVYALAEALAASPAPGNLAAEIAKLPGMDVEFYQPKGEDRQTPHERDETYVIARGSGVLELAGERRLFQTGDLIYVPAHAVHRFVEFSDDFAAWVLFWP